MMNFYVDAWKKFADFSGRSRRSEFWYFALINGVLNWVLGFLPGIGWILSLLFGLAIIVPGIAVGIRRMHDIGKSGWWCLINLIPLVGTIWFIVLAAQDSESGANKWGACPK